MSQTQTPIPRREKLTDTFRKLKLNQPIQIESTHQESPHSTAKLVGIKVKTEIVSKIPGGGFVLNVTRIVNRKTMKKGK